MTVALISFNPYTLIATYAGGAVPDPLTLPDGSTVAGVGRSRGTWVVKGVTYQIVDVPPFVPTAGQQVVPNSTPNFAIDKNGVVTQTFSTQAAPVVPVFLVTSNSTPAINGSYPTDTDTQRNIDSVAEYIDVNGKFPAGLAALPVSDINGTPHLFPTTALFRSFASAMADFVAAVDLGQTPPASFNLP